MKIILMHFAIKQSLQSMAASRDRVCELCRGHHLQLSAPTQWRNEEAHKYVTSIQVESDVLICKPCQGYIQNQNSFEKYLEDKAGFEGHIWQEQDKVCIPCYRSHIPFLHEENLIALIVIWGSWGQQLHTTNAHLWHNNKSGWCAECSYYQNNSICGRRVAQKTMQFYYLRCMIPSLAMLRNSSQQQTESEVVEVTKLVTSRWTLSNLTANLKHHISYSCRARKYGTLLYRSKSDLLSPLAQALWRVSKASTIQVRSDQCN